MLFAVKSHIFFLCRTRLRQLLSLWNPYQIRHTYASTMLTAGANPWYVASQLGHEDVEMVFRTYGKFIREDFQKPKPAPQLAK
ncbi:Site-specific recombinase XerD [Comamonas aquatica]|uniref:Site-specific recombinase XerD n=1 Tax=Comamonas aquatica TaxID=225991 RepID=A0AA35D9F1_9BURK|nr:Site-specific recombinase XerD [Comamonas aquatica]CAB5704337.1 Site-specific recombinase XerD [Comamonas aquatica]CAC9223388.1 Site-specific recombinase XerD [Comamonas aquatica]CAC9683491.1 Site-specific recombinase XerD [Comamonas aquatica]